ncbi:MAG: hypothetical protein VX589_11190 [Myxococcota bacterium]|nr:hypothetical protein [Myxococcota bacterium]
MKISVIVIALLSMGVAQVEGKPSHARQGQAAKKVGPRSTPKFVKNARLSVSSLNLVCPKFVWFGTKKKLPGTTSSVFKAKFHAIQHTKQKKYAIGAYQCRYKLPGASKSVGVYTTKRKYPQGGEWDGVKCTIQGRRLSCVETSALEIPNQATEVPTLK